MIPTFRELLSLLLNFFSFQSGFCTANRVIFRWKRRTKLTFLSLCLKISVDSFMSMGSCLESGAQHIRAFLVQFSFHVSPSFTILCHTGHTNYCIRSNPCDSAFPHFVFSSQKCQFSGKFLLVLQDTPLKRLYFLFSQRVLISQHSAHRYARELTKLHDEDLFIHLSPYLNDRKLLSIWSLSL